MMLLLGCWWVVGEFLYQGKPFRRFKEGGDPSRSHELSVQSRGILLPSANRKKEIPLPFYELVFRLDGGR
jgi:hypothetical protein